MNRQEDLSKVFDRTWTANHNDVAKRGRERERKFMNRMFGRKDNTETSHTTNNNLTPGMRVDNLQKNIADILNGLVYTDDALVSISVVKKIYGFTPRTEIVIKTL